MAPYHQHPASHSWDRWPQHQAGSDYVIMNDMVGYDTRPMPSSAPLQRPVMASQYVMGNSYGESPVTPMSASNYTSHSQFGDYGSYSQPSPSLTSFQQHSDRYAHRPMAPPTPPLDSDSHSIYSRDGQASYSSRDASRRSSTKQLTIVKREDISVSRTPKTIEPFKKEDGSLQWESNEKFDCLLRLIPKTLSLEDDKGKQSLHQPQQAGANGAAVKEEPASKAVVKKYPCQFPGCNRSFAQKAPWKTHEDTHKGIKTHQCDICGIWVSQAGNLQTHKRCHTDEKPFACGVCGKLFKQRGNVKPHIENVHEKKNKSVCNLPRCGRTFTTIGNLKNHIGKVHKAILDNLMYQVEKGERLDEVYIKLFKEWSVLFKNSNKGIKGRGHKDPKTLKHEQTVVRTRSNQRREETQQMTPVSPEPIHVGDVGHSRSTYYDHPPQTQAPFHGLPLPAQQQAQQQFHALPLPAQQQQQPPHYSSIPPYHTLPQPMGSSMGWTPAQYQ